MFDNNQQNSPCAFAEQLVSFLYGETDGRERDIFQAHLKTCAACADDFAAFGSVRASISVWRAAEFSVLSTPKIEIPHAPERQSKDKSAINIHSSGQTKSWLERLRETFAFSPALAAALFFVIVCAGLFALVHNFSGGALIAETVGKDNLPTNVSTKAAQSNSDLAFNADANQNAEQTTNVNNENNENSVSSNSLKINRTPPRNSPAAANHSAAKVSNILQRATFSKVKSPAPKTSGAPFVGKFDVSNSEVAQVKASTMTAAAKTDKLPKLGSIEDDDEDDELLLLADLVDEADKK